MSTQDFLEKALKRKVKNSEIKETDIESDFVKFAKKKGCHALKLIFLNKKGFPDRTILCPGGRIFFIEFKKKDKKQSPIQIVVMKMLKQLGFEYYVCDVKGQAESILQNFIK